MGGWLKKLNLQLRVILIWGIWRNQPLQGRPLNAGLDFLPNKKLKVLPLIKIICRKIPNNLKLRAVFFPQSLNPACGEWHLAFLLLVPESVASSKPGLLLTPPHDMYTQEKSVDLSI